MRNIDRSDVECLVAPLSMINMAHCVLIGEVEYKGFYSPTRKTRSLLSMSRSRRPGREIVVPSGSVVVCRRSFIMVGFGKLTILIVPGPLLTMFDVVGIFLEVIFDIVGIYSWK